MAIEKFVSGRGWDIETCAEDSVLRRGDTLIIGWLGGKHILLQFRRLGSTLMEGYAKYKNSTGGGIVAGTIANLPVRLSFTAHGILQIYIELPGGGESPNGGGTSSGPGGN